MKKEYDLPYISIMKFQEEDIIMLSGVDSDQAILDELEMDY